MQIIVGQQNTLAYTFTVTGGFGTLVISGETAWELQQDNLVRVYNSTHAGTFYLTANTTFSNTFTNGLPTYTWVWPTSDLPASSATSDTLLIYLEATPDQVMISLLQYQKA